MNAVAAVASATLFGCAPDLGGFTVVDRERDAAADADGVRDARSPMDGGLMDGEAIPPDGPSSDGGGLDAHGRWADADPRGDCPMPQLLVGLRVDDDGLGRNGVVARFGLHPEVVRCSDLTGEGRLPFRVDALTWVPPNAVVAAGDRGMVAVDIDSDAVLWEHEIDPFTASSTFPRDAFPMELSSGDVRTAVSFTFAGPSEIAFLRLYDGAGAETDEWDVRSASWPVEEDTWRLAARPRQPDRVLALTELEVASEVSPVSGARLGPWAPTPTGVSFDGLQVYDDGLFVRAAWVGTDGSEWGVYFIDTPDGSPVTNPPFGPVRCRGRGEESHVCARPEVLLDAVSDPTRTGRFFAICEGREGLYDHHVARFGNRDGPCEVVLNDGELSGMQRSISRLAVAVP